MELAIETGTIRKMGGPEDFFKIASDLEFKYIEYWIDFENLFPYTVTEQEVRNVVELSSSYGLKIVSTASIPFSSEGWETFDFEYNLANPNEKERQKAVKFTNDCADLTRNLGAQVMIALPGKIEQPRFMESEISYRKYFDQSVKSLRECAKHAEDVGVVLGLENAVVANFGDFPEELRRMVETVGSDYLKIYLDAANANVFRPPVEYVRALKDLMVDFMHITDNDGNYCKHLPIGMGTIDFKGLLTELKANGWDGYLVPEIFYEDTLEGLKQSRDNLLEIIKNI